MNAQLISADDFCRHTHIEISFLHTLEEHGLLQITTVDQSAFLDEEYISMVEKMARLHHDLSINPEGIGAVLQLLQRLEQTESELNSMRARLRFYDSSF